MSEIDFNDPFLVTSALGIKSVLRSLMKQKTLVQMHLDNDSRTIITAVLDVDAGQNQFIVDAADDDNFNRRLAAVDKIYFKAQIDGVSVQFRCSKATPIEFDNRPAFLLPFPDQLRRLQRRNHYRIDIPVSTPLFAQIPVMGGRILQIPVRDISAGGVALLDQKFELDVTVGAWLHNCTFDLDDLGTITTNLNVRRINEQKQADAKPVHVVACEFDHPGAAEGIMVQNYIGRLERMLNARRRGFD